MWLHWNSINAIIHQIGFLLSHVTSCYCSNVTSCYTVGAYTASVGVTEFRKDIAKFIEERDGYSADYRNIFMTNGASDGIRVCCLSICLSFFYLSVCLCVFFDLIIICAYAALTLCIQK